MTMKAHTEGQERYPGLSQRIWKLANSQGWLLDALVKRPSQRCNKPLHLEKLEERALFAGNGLFDLVSPTWFEDLGGGAAGHSSAAGYWTASTADQGGGSATGKNVSIAGSADTYDWIVRFTTEALDGISSVAQTSSLLVGGGIEFSVVRGLGLVGQVLVRSSGASLQSVEQYLSADSAVAHYDLDVVRSFDALPNDPQLTQLWGLSNTGQSGGRPHADIDAPDAWNISTGSSNVVVAVIDTGVDYTHSDLAANIWTNSWETAGNGRDDDGDGFVDDVHGYDFANNDGNPMDDNSHGTHVSGTIGGVGNNTLGVAGVNWSVSIMPLKFLSASGSGSTSDAVRAINYATMQRSRYGVNVRVLNCSWGGGGFDNALQDAIQAAGDAGILTVAAAGNKGQNNDVYPNYPSNYGSSSIIAVAATDRNDNLASFSNYGAASVDLAAPGVSIYSTIPGNGYAIYSGTSMATPHVAGVAALAWSVAPNASVADIRNAILQGADRIAGLSGKVATGGRLDAYNTLRLLSGGSPQTPLIASLTAAPNPVTAGAAATLTAHGIADAGGTLTGVYFYQDTNGDNQWDANDRLLGSTATIVGGEASLALSTSGFAPGNYTFFARAVDNQSQWSGAAGTVLQVVAPDDHGNDPTTATQVPVPGSIGGVIETGSDVDYFALDAVAGRTYTFQTRLQTLPDSVLALYGRDGTTLLSWNDDWGSGLASRIAWTAPTSGTYYLEVSAYSATQTGSYQLSLGAQNDPPVFARIGDQTISHNQPSRAITLQASDPNGDSLTYTAQVLTPNSAAASLAGTVLTITPRQGFLGSFSVLATVSDGQASVSQTFQVSVTNSAPVLARIGDQTMSRSERSRAITLQASDADGDSLRYTAQVLSYDPLAKQAYDLDQRLGLYKPGNYFQNLRGAREKWMQGNGGAWYCILPNGQLRAWAGKMSTSPVVATLSPAYYANPALLHDARPPVLTPSKDAAVALSGNVLTITPRSGFLGTFSVQVTVSDGIASAGQMFQVSVTNAASSRAAMAGFQFDTASALQQATAGAADLQWRQIVDHLAGQAKPLGATFAEAPDVLGRAAHSDLAAANWLQERWDLLTDSLPPSAAQQQYGDSSGDGRVALLWYSGLLSASDLQAPASGQHTTAFWDQHDVERNVLDEVFALAGELESLGLRDAALAQSAPTGDAEA
jgi:subtilisin family serine protease